MRKNFLLTVAIMVTAFFVGTTIAQAVSVEWGGELRPRFEYNEQGTFNSPSPSGVGGVQDSPARGGDYFVSSRIRLHAKADILPDTSAFIQLQSVRNWGNDLEELRANQPTTVGAGPGGGGSSGGSGNAAFAPSDNDNSVGIHQAYFTLKNFATLPMDLKVGRQEVVLDGHRLLGNTGWTQGAQTHDAARITHHEGNHTLSYIYSLANEGSRGQTVGSAANDNEDIEVHIIYANMQGILGGGLSLYYVGLDDDCSVGGGATGCISSSSNILDNNIYTVGLRQAGQLYGIDYRVEYYYQFGDAEGDALGANAGSPNVVYSTVASGFGGSVRPVNTVGGVAGTDTDINRSAYMFGARIGKKFNNVMWKPSITFWYDYLSGTDDEDGRDGDYKTFNTLFDTGHKFYGFMDVFLPANGAQTNRLGLVDYAVKASLQPAKGWKFKAAWHYFTTAEGIGANSDLSGAAVGTSPNGAAGIRDDGNALGNELDLTLVHKYNSNTTISAGWSHFWQEQGFELVNGGQGPGTAGNENQSSADWAYVMFDVKF